MNYSSFRPVSCLLGLVSVLFLGIVLPGCKEHEDAMAELDKEDQSLFKPPTISIRGDRNAVATGVGKFAPVPAVASPPANAMGALSDLVQAALAPADIRLYLKAGPPGPYAMFRGLINASTGRFIFQGTVAYENPVGFTTGQSCGGFRFVQSQFVPDGRTFFIGARYDASINGLQAFVSDGGSSQFGSTQSFSDAVEIDLRIQQTDTELVFSCRATPSDQSAGGWTVLHTEATPVDPSPFYLSLGLQKVPQGGKFFFNHLAADGDGLNGEAEMSVVHHLRETLQILQSAQDKIAASTPDLSGALADLDNALAGQQSALQTLRMAFVDYTLQRPKAGLSAQKTLVAAVKALTTTRAAVATLDAKKAKAQLAALEKSRDAHRVAIACMFGFKVTTMKDIPTNLYFAEAPAP